jgi:hypothetical protein
MKVQGDAICSKSLGVLLLLCAASNALAQADNVDWKLYGWADKSEHCFYEAIGATRRPEGHVRVWTKCLSQDSMDGVDIEKEYDGRILNAAAQKVASHYFPPIAKVVDLSFDQMIAVVRMNKPLTSVSSNPSPVFFMN